MGVFCDKNHYLSVKNLRDCSNGAAAAPRVASCGRVACAPKLRVRAIALWSNGQTLSKPSCRRHGAFQIFKQGLLIVTA